MTRAAFLASLLLDFLILPVDVSIAASQSPSAAGTYRGCVAENSVLLSESNEAVSVVVEAAMTKCEPQFMAALGEQLAQAEKNASFIAIQGDADQKRRAAQDIIRQMLEEDARKLGSMCVVQWRAKKNTVDH